MNTKLHKVGDSCFLLVRNPERDPIITPVKIIGHDPNSPGRYRVNGLHVADRLFSGTMIYATRREATEQALYMIDEEIVRLTNLRKGLVL